MAVTLEMRRKSKDSDGYEVPAHLSGYTDLNQVGGEGVYDVPGHDKVVDNKCSLKKKCCIIWTVIGLIILASGVSTGVFYYFLRKDANRHFTSLNCDPSQLPNNVCKDRDCGDGVCYVKPDGASACACPADRDGEHCENRLRLSNIETTCPVGWESILSSCYRVFSTIQDKKTWFQARDFCRGLGADLTSILSANENQNIHSILNRDRVEVWIGLSNVTGNGEYTWSDESKVTYTNWGNNEPNNLNDNEHCVHLKEVVNDNLKWNDNNCYMSKGFVCKKRKTDVCGTDKEWVYYKSQCYFLSENVFNFNQAKTGCEFFGSSLVKILTKEENNFLLSHVTKNAINMTDYWIGLSDLHIQGEYEWLDGTKPTYLSWNINQPNNNDHRCVKMRSKYGNWDDADCTELNKYICERIP